MRLFLGLPVPVELARSLIHAAQTTEMEKARWTAPENVHLTLVFLGEVRNERLPAIKLELAGLDARPLRIRITNLGSFPRAGVIFAEIDPAPNLLRLQAQTEEGMAHCGFLKESRPYRPHITLARFHPVQPFNRGRFASPATSIEQTFQVDTINLYCSHLSATGSRYEIIAQKRMRPLSSPDPIA
jgi:2'-5' RNA ligase